MSANPFAAFDDAGQENPFAVFDKPQPKRGFGSDVANALVQGVQQLPAAATGLADIPAGGLGFDRPFSRAADKLGSLTGFTPSQWAKDRDARYSPETQAAKQEIDEVWKDPNTSGWDVAGAYLRNPRATALNVVQSVPSMVAGGAAGRLVGGIAGLSGAATRAAIGEGSVMAGQQMDQIDPSVDPQRAAAAAAVTGVGGGLISAGAGKLASRLGFGDIDQTLAGGVTNRAERTLPLAARVPAGVVQEGLIEEGGQSALETGSQNWAERKPLTQGMARNVTEGALAGGVMGGGMAAMTRGSPASVRDAGPAAQQGDEQSSSPDLSGGDGSTSAAPAEPVAMPMQAPSEAMGINPGAGPLSAAAAQAVDAGLTGSLRVPPEIQAAEESDRDAAATAGSILGAPPESRPPSGETQDLAGQSAGSPSRSLPTPPGLASTYTSGQETENAAEQRAPSDQEQASIDATPGGASFATYKDASDYIAEQRRAGGTRMPALPLPRPDGTFGLALKGTPDYTIAQFDQRQRRQRAAGVLDGDILSKSGDIFATNRKGLAAIAAKRAGPGYAVVPVDGGFVARQVAEPSSTPDALAAQPAPDRVADEGRRTDTPATELTGNLQDLRGPATAASTSSSAVDLQAPVPAGLARMRKAAAAKEQTAAPTSDDEQDQAQYADAARQFNAMVPQLRSARAAGDTASATRLENAMRPLDTAMRNAQSAVQNRSLQRAAHTRQEEAAAKYGAMPIGTRQRPSEFPDGRVYWEKTGPDEWTRVGMGSTTLTRPNAQMDGTLPLEQAEAPVATPEPSEARAGLLRMRKAAADRARAKQSPATGVTPSQAPITDLGEKIGGARKDTAMSTGARGPRKPATEDTRPAWARRFQVTQIASSTRPGEEGRWTLRDMRSLDRMNQPRQVGRETYATAEEAAAGVPLAAVALKHRVLGAGEGKFEIWRDVSDRKRVKVVDRQFASREEALGYMAEHAAEIVETNTTFGEADLPVPENKQRMGPKRRTGDVDGQAFRDTFGFRGVEFGNWNNQAERQQLMNEAYDGLLDLADVLGIPPKAIALNGDLALAFGARGHGLQGARAHYERDRAVINLTKMKGAGALAHEWFHALDHYFGRQDGKASSEWKIGPDVTRTLSATDGDMASSGLRGERSGVRTEVRDAYAAVMTTMARKGEKYVEDTVRADNFVATSRDELAQALDRLRAELSETKDPKYWKRNAKPATAEQLVAFDTLAKSMVDGVGLETELRGESGGKRLTGMRWTNDALEQLSAIYKAVRGRSGFDATNHHGVLDRLRSDMTRYSQRLKMLADAQASTEKTKQVPTDFAMDARSLDQGRGEDYWTTPHEMAARAFQGYVEDSIAAKEGRSPFLNHAPENAAIITPWGWKRPYPHGKERKAINSALDQLVKTLQTRETETGTALFSRSSRAETHVAVQQVADAITANWQNGPEVIVARNIEDPALPQRIRDHEAEQLSNGASGSARGVYWRGKVYLIADQIRSEREAVEVLFHEALGHYGLRNAFGGSLRQVLDQVGRLRQADMKKKAAEYGLDLLNPKHRQIVAEEVLAELAQTRPEIGFVQRAVAAIRTWLRENVPSFKNLRLSDAELIRNFLVPARGFVERGDGPGSVAMPEKNPAFSRATDAKQVVTDLKHRTGNTLADYRHLAFSALGRRQLVEIYGKDLPQLDTYSKLTQQMDADKNEAGAGADQIATAWGKLKDENALASLMHDATLAQIEPSKPFVPGDDENFYEALKHGYDALTPEAKKVYADARDTYRTHHEAVHSAIRDRIERSEIRGERKADLLKQMDAEFFKAIKGVYFPLARFGQYVVVVRDNDGQTINVSRAETLNEAETLRATLRKAYPGDHVGKVLKAKEFNAGRDAVGRGFMEEMYKVLGKKEMDNHQRAELEDMLGQLYLSALPDLSWAKHGIHRKGTPGFSQDARRAFAQNVFHGARYLAKVRYSDLLENDLSAMQKHVDSMASVDGYDSVKAQQVIDEMVKRHDSMMNPDTNALSTALTSLGFVFHLGLSPASALVNLTQTAFVALPIMGAKWGFGKASAALLKASQQTAANKNDITSSLSKMEREAFDEAVRSGVIDVTMAHDLAGVSQGEDAKVSWKLRPVMKWASFLFHHAEKFNRQVTFVAAYRLAKEAGAGHKAAYEQAVKATYDGHFDYSASNRPRVMQGNVARVLLLFKQYAQNMIYTLGRQGYLAVKGMTPAERAEARKALGGLLAMHAAGAGVLGLPLVTTLLAAASMAGGSDDEPWDAEVALKNMLADALGQKPAEALTKGLSRLTPWDISGRVGLDKLILPDIQEGLEGQRLGESAMAAALGPVAGIGISALKGLQEIADGNWARGLETMAPSVARGPLKALRYGTEGAIDKTGKPIVEDVGAAGIAGQALGFSPSEVRLAQEGKSAIYQADQKLVKRRAELMRHYSMAKVTGDEEAAGEAKEAIQGFNEVNPDRRINALQMAASVRTRKKQIEESDQGVYLPKKRRDARDAGRFSLPSQ